MLFLRSVFFALLVPGTVVLLVPRWILARSRTVATDSSTLRLFGTLAIVSGGSMLVWCIWDFANKGRGTLAPVDPPTHLVVNGLYRYVRNPMYVGAFLVLAGQTALFESAPLLWYSILWLVCVHLFVVFHEERTLRRRFGDSYEHYCETVHRWLPKIRTRPLNR
jgi:protein-S-isoprenylcysteine O-methyltransferase Ste14